MKITGESIIPTDQETVWRGLNDPEVLRQSIPGCESLEKVGDNAFKATVVTRIGPVSAKFEGEVELTNLNPPNSYTLRGSGSAGPMGAATGAADVVLTPLPEGGTKLSYDVAAEMSGKIAQLGSRLIQSTAGMLAGKFFSRFSSIVAEGAAGADENGKSGSSLTPIIVGLGLAGVAAAVAYFAMAG